MKHKTIHPWDVPIDRAKAIQKELATRVYLQNQFPTLRRIAGADLSIDEETGEGVAGVVVLSYPGLDVLEKKYVRKRISYPYIPGLLSFREAPILLAAFEKVELEPDLIIFDGQGIAHPRRVGIASHMGLLLDKPSIGCAKSVLCGTFREPGKKSGANTPLFMGEKIIGTVLRTRQNVQPVFISPGHKIDLDASVRIVLECCDGYRLPKPTRLADRYVGEMKKKR